MKWKTFNFACACAVAAMGCIWSPDAAAGGGGMGGGVQVGGAAISNGQLSGGQISSGQVTGAQFSGARQGGGQTRNGGGAFFPSAQQGTQGYTHYYAYTTGNGAAFGTAIHEHHDEPADRPAGAGAGPSAGGTRGARSFAPNPSIVAPPVAILDPGSPATVSRTAATNANNGSAQAALAAPGQFHGTGAVAGTANRVLTRASQWRHDPGHPHHHRHFVYLNNSIFLLDEGVYDGDGPPDFSTGPDAFSSTYEDGYYDTFDPPVVGQVQARLAAEGYYNGVIDNMLKPDLRDAIAKYQQEHGLPVSGAIDEPLLKELGLLP